MKIGFQHKLFLCFVGIIFLTLLPLTIYLSGYAESQTTIKEIRLLISREQQMLILGLLLSVAIALILSLIIARRFAYPVDVMTRIARKIAKRDFSEKVKITTHDEHAELAHSLNEMSLELEHHMLELSRVNSELEAAFSSMKEGILVINQHGQIVHFNKACKEMFRVENNPVGQSELDTIRHVPLHDMLASVLVGGQAKASEIILENPKRIELLTSITPLKQRGDTLGAVAVFHDVTELRKLERMRRDFVANVSHELKTPLTAIKGFSEALLSADLKDTDLLRKNIETIHRKSEELQALISDVLELAAIESGEIRMKKQGIDLKLLFQSVMDELKQTIQEKKLRVSTRTDETLPSIEADERWIRQALLNLLTNACAYTNPGGIITLGAYRRNSNVILEVKDTGIGIAEKDLPRIFERFYRTEKARSRTSGGTGLGLSIVKHVVEAHGGEISVTSRPGEGSTFQIILPA